MKVPRKTSFLTSYLNIAKSIEAGMRINVLAVLINLLQEDNFLLDIFFYNFCILSFEIIFLFISDYCVIFLFFFYQRKKLFVFSAIIDVNSSLDQIVYQYKNS